MVTVVVRHAVPRAAAAAQRLRAVDAARRGGDLPEGRRADHHDGRRLPGRDRAGGRRRVGLADLRAAARGRADRPGDLLRTARGPRRGGGAQRRDVLRRASAELDAAAGRRRRPPGRPSRCDRVVLDMLSPWEALPAVGRRAHTRAACWSATSRRRPSCPGWSRQLREHGGFTEPHVVGDAAARLARGRAGGAPGAPDDRPHRVPGDRAAAGARRHRAAAAPAPPRDRSGTRPTGAGSTPARPATGVHRRRGPATSTSSASRTTWMQSPGHSFAEAITSSRSLSGTSARAPGVGQQVAGVVLHVGQPVDVELEHLGRVLDAQPVAGAQLLVDPHAQVTHGWRRPSTIVRAGRPGAVCSVSLPG